MVEDSYDDVSWQDIGENHDLIEQGSYVDIALILLASKASSQPSDDAKALHILEEVILGYESSRCLVMLSSEHNPWELFELHHARYLSYDSQQKAHRIGWAFILDHHVSYLLELSDSHSLVSIRAPHGAISSMLLALVLDHQISYPF